MAEKTILVCDACGKPAAETVTIKSTRGNLVKDLCSTHVSELVAGARKPRPGRRKGVVAGGGGASKARSTNGRRKAGARKAGARKSGAKVTPTKSGKRRGRPPKSPAA
jgi:hypothetical protein